MRGPPVHDPRLSYGPQDSHPLITGNSPYGANALGLSKWWPAALASSVVLLVCLFLVVYARQGFGSPAVPEQPVFPPTPSPLPPPYVVPVYTSPAPQAWDCLCVFDIDRTITGKQGHAAACPGNTEMVGVPDAAYSGGTLVLSQLGQGIQSTFCGRCYRGIVTAGSATGEGSAERTTILSMLGGTEATLSSRWSSRSPVTSSMVVGAIDGRKQEVVRDIVAWFQSEKGITIAKSRVYFFDDRDGNVPPFAGTGFNAQQISCASRDGVVGLCGATLVEVVEAIGVHACT